MNRTLLLAILATGLALSTSVSASARSGEIFAPGKPLVAQVDQIERELNDGETYSEIRQEDRIRVRESLVRLRSAAEKYPDRNAMPESARTELHNDQQVVNTVLTQAREDSRLICRREKIIGSNRAVSQCMTVAERERLKDKAQRDMGQVQRGGGKFVN